MPQMSPSAKAGTALAFVLSALGLAGTGVAQSRTQLFTEAQWTKIELAARNPILPEICAAITDTLIKSLRTPEARAISSTARNGIIDFALNPATGRANCSGNRLFPWTRANKDYDLVFLATAIKMANQEASAIATVKASKEAGYTVRINVHLPTDLGVAPARNPVDHPIGSLEPGIKGGPSG